MKLQINAQPYDLEFGTYIKKKRKDMKLTLRALGEKLGMTQTYINDVENGRRKAFQPDRLKLLAEIFEITDTKELFHFYDLAAKSKGTIPWDVEEFLIANPSLVEFIRKVKYKKYIDNEYMDILLSSINTEEDKNNL